MNKLKELLKGLVCWLKGSHDDEQWPHIDLIYLTRHERSKCKTVQCNFCGRVKSIELGRG